MPVSTRFPDDDGQQIIGRDEDGIKLRGHGADGGQDQTIDRDYSPFVYQNQPLLSVPWVLFSNGW